MALDREVDYWMYVSGPAGQVDGLIVRATIEGLWPDIKDHIDKKSWLDDRDDLCTQLHFACVGENVLSVRSLVENCKKFHELAAQMGLKTDQKLNIRLTR